MSLTFTSTIHFQNGHKGAKQIELGNSPTEGLSQNRVPRLTRLMALALKFEQQIQRGELKDYATLARLGKITRARATQIMSLTLLASDIVEEILALEPIAEGRDPLVLRDVLPIAQEPSWTKQRKLWKALKARKQES
jgi:hypothetical protein